MRRTPGSGYGSVWPFHRACTLPRTAVTARKAWCLVLRSFLPAERYSPSAPNDSAASAFCWGERLLRTPNHMNDKRTAAMVARIRWEGVDDGRTSTRSRRLVLTEDSFE